MSSWFAAHSEKWDPRPPDAAVLTLGRARFTVLTSRLLRLEWADEGVFEDRASLAFVNRRLPATDVHVEQDGSRICIRTGDLVVEYRDTPEGFTAEHLEIRFQAGGVETTWRPGDDPAGNLGGTIRTLDATDGAKDMGRGVLSRDGWALVDDSGSPLFDGGDPRVVTPRAPGSRLDWYFFAHGRDYRGALADLAAVSGKIPMPPRWALGIWWSRYWAYSEQELIELVEDFDRHEVPLDVLVVDMDWHQTFDLVWGSGIEDAAGQPKGWTGYTWNSDCFPDPEGFLDWARGKGLRVPLNLHPASGIQPWEVQYPAVARAMGVDPESGDWIPFRAEDPDFAEAYFEHVIHPLERQGVDFWWLDWQQGSKTEIPGLTPTMWLNHLFFTDMERQGRSRPVILHRFGGLGSHRYQVGFSGDAHSTWESLAFQPHFTATASNVLYGYWSHDIGGHEPGPVTPELYTRWIQFGVYSPIFRTHATKHPDAERRVWAFPEPYRGAMLAAVRQRIRLLPYIYSAAREAHDTGVSLVRPMYYEEPEAEEAYACPGQYMFGPDLLVHPITEPANASTGLVKQATWLPPGRWVAWESGEESAGGQRVEASYGLEEVPVFARAGAIVPMGMPACRTSDVAAGPLVLRVFPGGDGATRIYEDAGDDLGYRDDEFSWTPVRTFWGNEGSEFTLVLGPTEGSFPGMLGGRTIIVQLVGMPCPVVEDPSGATCSQADGVPEVRIELGPGDLRRSVVIRLVFPTARPNS